MELLLIFTFQKPHEGLLYCKCMYTAFMLLKLLLFWKNKNKSGRMQSAVLLSSDSELPVQESFENILQSPAFLVLIGPCSARAHSSPAGKGACSL